MKKKKSIDISPFMIGVFAISMALSFAMVAVKYDMLTEQMKTMQQEVSAINAELKQHGDDIDKLSK
ncbi:TPA: hypothetical protein RQN15_002186 [Aeromonas hydrophila]|nr:hypothetical protein [Aeromonas hydrophila]